MKLPKTITVQLRCLNVDSDGGPEYDDNDRMIITVEPKRRPSRKFCPDDVAEGFRAIKYRHWITSDRWHIPLRCECHGLMVLGYED